MNRILALIGALLLVAGILVWRLMPAQDFAVLMALHVSTGLARGVDLFTNLGSAKIMVPFALVLVVLLVRRGDGRRALTLALAVAIGRVLVEIAKAVIARPRPPIVLHLSSVESLSMPSSHAAGSMLTCLLAAAAFGGGRRIGAALMFSLMIGISRVMLGVHYPSDVLAGWGVGLLWAAAWWRWVELNPTPMRNGHPRGSGNPAAFIKAEEAGSPPARG